MANVTGIKTQPPVNRLRGSLPKIGIRPTIDGRYGGVRESLEAQVMGMAQTTADFLSANLTHACGLPVECVIADTCIGGVSEAAKCAEKFAREGVGVSPHGDPLLVLRLGDHGYGSRHPKSDLGIQWNRAPWRSLSGRHPLRPQRERAACLRHLWP